MEKKIRIGVFDDNEHFLKAMDLAMKVDPEIEIVCRGNNGHEAMDLILTELPDVVLLDVIMPGMDGLEVLQQISRLGKRVKSKFIMLSAVGAESIVQEAFAYGAAYFIRKPFDSHLLIRRIHQCMGDDDSGQSGDLRKEQAMLMMTSGLNNQEACVDTVLHKIGISVSVKGYQYLKDAILVCIDDRNVLGTITKVLYPTVAQMNQTTPERVERAIRHAIEAAWLKGSNEVVVKMFSYSAGGKKGKPTNSEFIALISDRVRTELKYKGF